MLWVTRQMAWVGNSPPVHSVINSVRRFTLAHPTGNLGNLTVPEESPHRAVMMPTRRQTREQDRRDRITNERRQRQELNVEQERQKQAWLAATYEPPPF